DLVRRVRAVDHAERRVVTHDRRPTQTLEQSDLNLLRPQDHQPVEAGGEAVDVLPRQADDQVRVYVNARVLAQEAQVLGELVIVLPPADSRGNFFVERLDPHFKLQRPGGEARDRLAQRLGQAIGDHLKVQEQPRRVAVEEELKDRARDVDVEVEGSIDKLEL